MQYLQSLKAAVSNTMIHCSIHNHYAALILILSRIISVQYTVSHYTAVLLYALHWSTYSLYAAIPIIIMLKGHVIITNWCTLVIIKLHYLQQVNCTKPTIMMLQ